VSFVISDCVVDVKIMAGPGKTSLTTRC